MYYIILFISLLLVFPNSIISKESQWGYWINKSKQLRAQKKYKEAKPFAEKALGIAKKDFGNKHIYTGHSLLIYGIILGRLKEFERSEQSLNRALELYTNHFGKENENIAIIFGAMANVQYMKGNYTKSEKLSEKALKLAQKVKLEKPIEIITIYSILSYSFMKNGKYKKAEQMFNELIKEEIKFYGENHPEVLTTLNTFGVIYLEQNKLMEAQKIFEKLLRIRKKGVRQNRPKLAILYSNIGAVYFSQKNYKKAYYAFQESFSLQKRIYGSQNIKLIHILFEFAKFYYETKKYTKSLEYCSKILKIMNKQKTNHPKRADLLSLIGYNYYLLKNYKMTLRSLQKANGLYLGQIKEKYVDYIDNVIFISLSYEHQNKLEDSEQNYLNALDFLMDKIGHYHPALVKMLLRMKSLYVKLNKDEDLKALKKWIEIIKSKSLEKKSSFYFFGVKLNAA